VTKLAKDLLNWFETHGRKNFPWQSNPPNVYHIWVSEVMLQQTQVITATGYFNRFLKTFPDIEALANAKEDKVMAEWAGLGYYSRALNLHKAAKIITSKYGGIFPKSFEEIVSLPGIGPSTAGAILSLGSNIKAPILDGNVKRVLSRYHRVEGHYSKGSVTKELWKLAFLHTPSTKNAKYTQAIMDLGATTCTPKNPNCESCPISSHCSACLNNEQEIFPHKRQKMLSRPERNTAFLIFKNEKQEVFLKRRPSQGIWGGLWSFEECQDNESIIAQKIKQHNTNATIQRRLEKFKHGFTHYDLWISPVLIDSPGGSGNYYKKAGLSKGVPAPVKKIIHSLE
jgi:A/G-specific adenine glycosylase